MNWFDLKDLENRLINNNVSDKEGFNYLLVTLILFSLTSYIAADDFYNNGIFLLFEIVLSLLITVIGLKLTFKANDKGDGNDYLKRFLSLSFVISIRLFVFIAIPLIILVILLEEAIANTVFQDLGYIVCMLVIGIIYYSYLIQSFKKVAESKV